MKFYMNISDISHDFIIEINVLLLDTFHTNVPS